MHNIFDRNNLDVKQKVIYKLQKIARFMKEQIYALSSRYQVTRFY